MELIQNKSGFIVNDCVSALKDILRKYPGRFEGVLAIVCENLDNIDSAEAKQVRVRHKGIGLEALTLYTPNRLFTTLYNTVPLSTVHPCSILHNLIQPSP